MRKTYKNVSQAALSLSVIPAFAVLKDVALASGIMLYILVFPSKGGNKREGRIVHARL